VLDNVFLLTFIEYMKNMNVLTAAHNFLSPSTSRQNLIPHKEIEVSNQDLHRYLVNYSAQITRYKKIAEKTPRKVETRKKLKKLNIPICIFFLV